MDKMELEMKSQIDEWLLNGYYDKIYNFFLNGKDRTWIEHNSMAYMYVAMLIYEKEISNNVDNHVLARTKDSDQILNDFRWIRFMFLRNEFTEEETYDKLFEFAEEKGYSFHVFAENLKIVVENPQQQLEKLAQCWDRRSLE